MGASPAIQNALVALQGPLGAGKTTFARALLQSLGVQGRIKSPTYALLETYEVQALCIAHLDLYRMNQPREWETAGLRDTVAAPGLKLVEWPERALGYLPQPDLTLSIEVLGDVEGGDEAAAPPRRVTLQAHSASGESLMAAAAVAQPVLAA